MIYQIVESLIKKSPNKNKQLRFVISSQGLQDFIYAKCPSFQADCNFWGHLMASTITNQTEKDSFNKPLLRKKTDPVPLFWISMVSIYSW